MYGYAGIIPTILWGAMKWYGCEPSLLDILCLYGYGGMIVWIPVVRIPPPELLPFTLLRTFHERIPSRNSVFFHQFLCLCVSIITVVPPRGGNPNLLPLHDYKRHAVGLRLRRIRLVSPISSQKLVSCAQQGGCTNQSIALDWDCCGTRWSCYCCQVRVLRVQPPWRRS